MPIYLLPFLRYSEIFVKKSSFYHTPLHSTPPLGGFPSEYRHPLWVGKTRMVSLSDGGKIAKISLFVLTWSTNVTDRHCVTVKTALASHRAVKTHEKSFEFTINRVLMKIFRIVSVDVIRECQARREPARVPGQTAFRAPPHTLLFPLPFPPFPFPHPPHPLSLTPFLFLP